MRYVISKYCLFIWMICPSFLLSQQVFSPKKIIGRVLAEDTDAPLAFAHLSVGGNEIGTICNEEGLFILKIPMRLKYDSLQVRYLGYQPKMFAVEKMGEDTLTIRLKSSDLTLKTVLIPSISPKDTLRKAWRRQKVNYEIRPTLLRGFYREEMEDTEFDIQFLFAEGVLELYKSPYHKNREDRVRVLKGRQKNLPIGYKREEKEFFLPQITQGPHLGLLLDVMKSKKSFVRGSNQMFYEYSFQKVQYHNNRLTYLFSFSPKNPSQTYAIFQGQIYLDLESLAIVRASYEFTDSGILLYNQNSDKLKLNSRSFEINYMEYQGRWYLQDARVVNQYYFSPVDRTLHSSHTFITTEIINDQVDKFPMNKTLSLDEAFVKSVEVLDEEFWEEYNVVPVKKE